MTLLGIDIGGSKRVLAVGDHTSRIFARERHPMRFSGDWRRDLAGIIGEARDLVREASEAGRGPLEAVGVSAPGPVELRSGILRNPPNLPGWRDVPLGRGPRRGLRGPGLDRERRECGRPRRAPLRRGSRCPRHDLPDDVDGRRRRRDLRRAARPGGERLRRRARPHSDRAGGAPLLLRLARLSRGVRGRTGLVEAPAPGGAPDGSDRRARRGRPLDGSDPSCCSPPRGKGTRSRAPSSPAGSIISRPVSSRS